MIDTFVKNSKNLSDEQLIKKINSGEFEFLHELIKKYLPTVHFYAANLALHESDVDDLVQEGIIALYSAVRSFRADKSSFATYATLCIKRAMLGDNRTKRRKKRIPDELCESLDETPEIAGVKSAENIYIEKESLKDLADNIKLELSEFEYKVLSSFLSGAQYAVIADECGVNVKSVDNALRRIRQKLKSHNIT